ncbi:class I SAM-dependent methyltransferase [Streptomyces sp. NRRL S-495]|uniref:class I SAM-dependent methyltransferase n=1 Tax=Streptomyces sp. NRRL S-495 TaxID=1609133 RepID=UPI00099C19E2|nr:class I SAM-dependent methyltransferase [Streptomyces sp. NRRL S-495]
MRSADRPAAGSTWTACAGSTAPPATGSSTPSSADGPGTGAGPSPASPNGAAGGRSGSWRGCSGASSPCRPAPGCWTPAAARARQLAARFGLRVTGVDLMDFHIREARRLSARAALEDRTAFAWGDFHELDLPAGSFDGVYSMETLCHAHDPARALAEFHRLLRPGGRLVLLGPAAVPRAEMPGTQQALLDPYLDAMVLPGARRYTTRTLGGLVTGAGFRLEEELDATRYYLPTTEALYGYFRLPYAVLRRLGATEHWLGLRSTVEMYELRHHVAWMVHTAVKDG